MGVKIQKKMKKGIRHGSEKVRMKCVLNEALSGAKGHPLLSGSVC